MSNQNPPPGDQGNQGNQDWGNPGNQGNQGSENPYAAPSGSQQGYGGGQQGQPQQYGGYQQGAYGQQQSSGGSGMAITALVLGILSIIGAFFLIGGYLLGIPAIIVGAIASSKAKKGRAQGRGMAIAGIVTGVLGLLGSIIATIFIVFIVQNLDLSSYTNCLQSAGDDATAVAECDRQFEDQVNDRLGG